MPFLCVLAKKGRLEPDVVAVPRLAERLCPYRGEVRRLDLDRGALFVSELAGDTAGALPVRLPRGTAKSPQTAWLELALEVDDVLRFETDPLGTFPLWRYEDDELVVVTSEVKAFSALDPSRRAAARFREDAFAMPRRPPSFSPYVGVRRVRPGATLRITRELAITEEGEVPLVYRPEQMLPPEEHAPRLAEALVASARAIGAGSGPWAAFVSGGIDSSVAAALLGQMQPGLATFTLGTDRGDEYAEAGELAAFLRTKHTRVLATEADAARQFRRAVFANETVDGLTAETLAQLGHLAEAAGPGVKRVVTGYGADLLFGSMLRHRLYMQVTGVDDLQSLIERTAWSGEFAPFYAWSLGVEVHHLFWDPTVMNTAFRIPPEASFDGTQEKLVLRGLAEEAGWLRREHAFRTKKALTDGTQFNQTLSSALGLSGPHAYGEKDARAIELLRELLEGRPLESTP